MLDKKTNVKIKKKIKNKILDEKLLCIYSSHSISL
jgi:hypothetical protein